MVLRLKKRERRVKRGRENLQRQTSVFVSNLPAELDRFGLKGIFHNIGKVVDTYIPGPRQRNARRRYGFVRFRSWYEAVRSIQLISNKVVRGHRLQVSMARSNKRMRRDTNSKDTSWDKAPTYQDRRQWRVKNTASGKEASERVEQGRQIQDKPKMEAIQGKINEEFVPWLSRSLVCTTQEPRDLATLADAIIQGYGQCTKICALSGLQFILTFQSEAEMEYALSNHEELDNWFTDIKKWDKYDYCSTRKVWLEVIGVPPHGWSWETFSKIAEIWGFLICLSKPILRTDTFASLKLLVETNVLSSIERNLIIQIEDLGYRVHVREVSSIMTVTPEAKQNSVRLEEAVDSNHEVPGFDDVAMQVESTDEEIEGDQGNCNDQSENHHHPEDGRRSIRSNSNSNLEGGNEEPVLEVQEEDINSDTRTKTASLINNECSEDVFMNAKKAAALRKEEEGLMINAEQDMEEEDSIQVPPGFGPVDRVQSSRPLKAAAKEHNRPYSKSHGKDPRTITASGENNRVIEARRSAQTSNKGNQKGNQSPRDNKKKGKIQPPAESSDSWDSCDRLANEALQIGELLGIKVIRNKKVALAELAESIGKKKVKKSLPRQSTNQEQKSLQN